VLANFPEKGRAQRREGCLRAWEEIRGEENKDARSWEGEGGRLPEGEGIVEGGGGGDFRTEQEGKRGNLQEKGESRPGGRTASFLGRGGGIGKKVRFPSFLKGGR